MQFSLPRNCLNQRHSHNHHYCDHERHEVKDGRHHTQARAQFLRAGLRLGDELVRKGLGERFEQALHLHAPAHKTQLNGETDQPAVPAPLGRSEKSQAAIYSLAEPLYADQLYAACLALQERVIGC